MTTSFFYDLETSGFSPRAARIMQFAGQRTDMDLKPIGEPVNTLITMTDDTLPDPDAILVTSITPQQTLTDGISEAEFLKLFTSEVATPGTIFVGYNTVRFDDEFMRFLHYRNFYDPYEWQWKDSRSRWDLLDVVRMTRALRPNGIKWPVENGKPTNRLEQLTTQNKLEHANAHDALSDVLATIDVARLIKSKQPKLFDFLVSIRGKRQVAELVSTGKPFVYTSGKYPGEFEKTTVVVMLAENTRGQGALVYDLRHDPTKFAKLSPEELTERWQYTRDGDALPRLPVKSLQYNRCPAVAPLSVLDDASQKRLQINLKAIDENLKKLTAIKNWPEDILKALELLDKQRQDHFAGSTDVDGQLYDGFFDDSDRRNLTTVSSATPDQLKDLSIKFHDERLNKLLPFYKARNFKQTLTTEERQTWDKYRADKLLGGGGQSQFAKFGQRLAELGAGKLSKDNKFLLDELQLWAESIMPDDVGDESE